MTNSPPRLHRPADEYRKLPAVDALLQQAEIRALTAHYGQPQVVAALRTLLADVRAGIAAGGSAPAPESWARPLADALHASVLPSLRRAINATGVIVHTNLGRAPLSQAARAAVDTVAAGYSNLEYDLATGQRGSRHDHARQRLRTLTGAEDALIVNNNAAAVYLVLAALCRAREVIISRGELVEIGGGFRIPDVLRQSGCRLVEVGTTNRTHVHDYAGALSEETAALMRVHSSNFRRIGFVTEPTLDELAALAHSHSRHDGARTLLIDDLGSGTLLATRDFGLAAEPMVQESLSAGADLVTFSGDKLLGGPQAGLIVGHAEPIARLRRHPMARALRVDKMTLAALDATLLSYQQGRAVSEIPVWQMIGATAESLAARVNAWQQALAGAAAASGRSLHVVAGESTVGGGSLPGETLPTWLLAITGAGPDALAAALRSGETPVVARIQQDQVVLDPRTVLPEQEADLLANVQTALRPTT